MARRKWRRGLAAVGRRWWLIVAGALSILAVTLVALFLGNVPLPEALRAPESSKMLAVDGELIGLLHGEENRTIVPLDGVSKALHEAVVATEDRNFYQHPGVSARGIIRATWANLRGRALVQGGSTITQQYVRNAFEQIGRERTILRKIKEAALAVKLERRYSKDKILEFYLNTVYFGRGAYGAEAASRTYFKKAAADLTLSEAAYLAGIIRAPENYKSEESALQIRDKVLGDMVVAGYLEERESRSARNEVFEFSFGPTVEDVPVKAAYFYEFVRRLLTRPVDQGGFGLSDRDLLAGGLEIRTTLDLRMQAAAESAIASTLDRPDDPEAALVAIDPTGQIKAMVGGREFTNLARARGFNFAYQKGEAVGGRQAGSAFKPFTLASWVDQGKSVRSVFRAPGEIVIPSPQCQDENGKVWEVANFDHRDLGQIDVLKATALSVNTVYAQIVDMAGPAKVKALADRIGGFGNLEAVCSIALGTSGVTPVEMARSFSTFAARGVRPDVLAVLKITSPDGRVIAEPQPHGEQVIDRNVADTVNHVLQGVIQSGTGSRLSIGRPAAGKTGTTQEHVDAWFVGYTPNLVASVWMGFPPEGGKIRPMANVRGIQVTGSSFPGTIWRKFMMAALEGIRPAGFAAADLGGEVVNPSPSPCPPEATPPPGVICVTPSPSPSPSPSPKAKPSPKASPTPEPSPTPSPTPTKKNSPSPSPNGDE